MSYYGIVIQKGKGLGKSVLGFPTANGIARIGNATADSLVGAWVVIVYFNGKQYKGFSGLSKRGTDIIFETHLLDFDGDLYGKGINITLVKKIREAITFKSLDESKEQIVKDYEFTLNWDLNRSCSNCKFFIKQDHGYSNYTVEGTTGSCSIGKHPIAEFDISGDHQTEYDYAKECGYFNEGECWNLDVDGEEPGPTDEWLAKERLTFERDVAIDTIIKK